MVSVVKVLIYGFMTAKEITLQAVYKYVGKHYESLCKINTFIKSNFPHVWVNVVPSKQSVVHINSLYFR